MGPAPLRQVSTPVAEEISSQPAAEMVAAEPRTSVTSTATSAAPVAEISVASREIAPAKPPQPTPGEILGQAVSDAQMVLTHIDGNVRDYVCHFVKRERIDGELLPVERIRLKVRNERVENGKHIPFSVYMKFLAPPEVKNREILYVKGENNGKMLAKEGGTKGRFLPSVWITPTCGLAMKANRYPITEVGFKRLTERLIESAMENDSVDECQVKYLRGAKVNGSTCTYLEVVRKNPRPGPLGPNNIYLAQVFMDEELKVPVRYAAYDWPSQQGGSPEVVEEYTYQNVKLNVGLTDEDFSKDNSAYRF